jgi:hypothetical protein
MKTTLLTLTILFTSFFGFSQSQDEFFKKTDTFLKTFVNQGLVEYTTITVIGKNDLKELTNHLENSAYDKNIEKAYLINAYNLFVINKVVKAFPVNSPMDVPAFFDTKDCNLNGEMISLNHLENEILRKTYKDARLHFVLVCAGLGCPPITNFSYTSTDLEKQLNQQTSIALNNNKFVYQKDEDKTIYLSEIFTWYASDFGKNNKEIITFINQYRKVPFSLEYKVKSYSYDWALNNGRFIKGIDETPLELEKVPSTPIVSGVSSPGGQTFNAGTLLRKGQFDFTLFNTMYTQTKKEWQGITYDDFGRETFNSHLIQLTYGNSKSMRINVGLDINFKSSGSSVDQSAKGLSSAFAYTNTDSTRVGITALGLRLKFQPLKKVSNFTVQSTLQAPTIKFAEGKNYLYWADWERITFWNQLFYTKSFGKFQLFTELDLLFRLKIYKNQSSMLDLPMSVFFSYFPTNKITFYAMSQHVPRFAAQSDTDWVIPSNYTASGLGFKYQINRGLNIELLYTNFWRGNNNGLGNTFNLGIKYITK